jgi:endonuclease-3
MANQQAANILQVLEQTLAMPNWTPLRRQPFETLDATIISGNSAHTNTARIFENESNRFEIAPQAAAKAHTRKLEAYLHVAGIYKSKAKTIQVASRIIFKRFDDSLAPLSSLPMEETWKTLLELPEIGPKMADVLLLFLANQPTIPVDTHFNRRSKRLGLAPENADYKAGGLILNSLIDEKDYWKLHRL